MSVVLAIVRMFVRNELLTVTTSTRLIISKSDNVEIILKHLSGRVTYRPEDQNFQE